MDSENAAQCLPFRCSHLGFLILHLNSPTWVHFHRFDQAVSLCCCLLSCLYAQPSSDLKVVCRLSPLFPV